MFNLHIQFFLLQIIVNFELIIKFKINEPTK